MVLIMFLLVSTSYTWSCGSLKNWILYLCLATCEWLWLLIRIFNSFLFNIFIASEMQVAWHGEASRANKEFWDSSFRMISLPASDIIECWIVEPRLTWTVGLWGCEGNLIFWLFPQMPSQQWGGWVREEVEPSVLSSADFPAAVTSPHMLDNIKGELMGNVNSLLSQHHLFILSQIAREKLQSWDWNTL